jgi:hypothetical protein
VISTLGHQAISRYLLKAKLITGNPLSSDCQVTGEVMKVQKLLRPRLAPWYLQYDALEEIIEHIKILHPGNAVCSKANSHLVNELGIKPSRFPTMFPKAPCSVAGCGDGVEIPKIAQDD